MVICVLGPKPVEPLRARVTELVLENKAATVAPIVFEILRGARSVREQEILRSHMSSLHVLPFAEPDWTEAADRQFAWLVGQ